MNLSKTMKFINSYSKSGTPVTDLSRVEDLMKRIGNPEKKLKFIHIAGTNGKGSVVEYVSNALIYSGYKTGQFTSPYILNYTDRIRINGVEIDEKSLCGLSEKVCERIEPKYEYSQFEITMAIALMWFEYEKCDIVVFECGIGGLLDCTNIIPPPLLSIITSISLDHTAILGDTVEKIALHKAGIIKEGSTVILAQQIHHPNVTKIVESKAEKKHAEFIQTKKCEIQKFNIYNGQSFIYCNEQYKTAMLGYAQPINASASIEVCLFLRKKGFYIFDENIKKSIETTQVKARVQLIVEKPLVIVDGGHNPDGMKNLVEVLFFANYPVFTIIGMIDSKDYKLCVEKISRISKKLFSVDSFSHNAVNAEKLSIIASKYTSSESCYSLEYAVKKAKKLALDNGGIMVICGSLYLASDFLIKKIGAINY